MSTKPDDLEAVRLVVTALEPFQPDEQERILRWAREKLNLSQAPTLQGLPVVQTAAPMPPAQASAIPGLRKDIKSFVAEKNPTSDNQFAAVAAYYYAFEAPEAERKSALGSDDIQEACRKAGRARLANPGQTLRNACFAGLLDKAGELGAYKINSVGENLVAMTLPGQLKSTPVRKRVAAKSPKRSSK